MQSKDVMNKDISILNKNMSSGEGTTSSEIKYSSAEILVESKEHSVIWHQPVISAKSSIINTLN